MTVSMRPSEAEVLAAQALQTMAAAQKQPLDPTVEVIAGARRGRDGYKIDLTDDQAENLRAALDNFTSVSRRTNGHAR